MAGVTVRKPRNTSDKLYKLAATQSYRTSLENTGTKAGNALNIINSL